MTAHPYPDSAAMRMALEQRLLARHRSTNLPLDRLRKEAALQRLLARIAVVAPANSWALKGGLAMIARVGDHARATSDADATWRLNHRLLRDMLDRAVSLDLADYFEFTVAEGKRIRGEGPEGGFRLPVMARLASKEFEQLRLDVNIVEEDPRPIELITLRNLLDFAGLPPVVVPAIRPEQQLAEKLHAYTRNYGGQENGRSKDLYDMLVIAQELPLPELGGLAVACGETFALRATAWPPTLKAPPSFWSTPWQGYVTDYGIQFKDIAAAYVALEVFWRPVFEAISGAATTWDSEDWNWR